MLSNGRPSSGENAAVQSTRRRRIVRINRCERTSPDNSMGNIYICSLLVVLATSFVAVQCGDIMRKSIVFDKNTPDVFYCPQHKPIGFEKMLVKAQPLRKLCEFEGRPLPEDYKSDCYNDVDETEYACKEKYRIMKRSGWISNPDVKAIDNVDYIEEEVIDYEK